MQPDESAADFIQAIGTQTPDRAAASEVGSQAGFHLQVPSAPSLPELQSLQFLPTTFGMLQASAVIPQCLKVFAVKIGMLPSTPLVHFLAMPEEDLVATITAIVDEGGFGNPMERGELVFTIRLLFQLGGVTPPALGAAGLPITPMLRAPMQQPPSTALVSAPAAPAPPPVLAVPLRKYVDQNLTGEAVALTRDQLNAARARYEQFNEGVPDPEAKPTSEQLAALQTIISAGRAPYVDFAVWNVWGPRLAQHQDTDATVLIDNKWVTRRIKAPASYTCWRASWDLFEVAMISLGHASRGALNRYGKCIEKLAKLFPNNWDILLTMDVLVRSERWQDLREKYARHLPDGFSDDRPWSYVIACSAFGGPDPDMQAWWSTMVVIPLSKSPSSAAARKTIGDVEGILPEHLAAGGDLLRGGAGSSRDRRSGGRSRSPARRREVRSEDACWYWNRKMGTCAGRGPCRNGFAHGVCDYCGVAGHRSVDRHPEVSKGKGKNKDKGKGKGKNKGKKGDKDEAGR